VVNYQLQLPVAYVVIGNCYKPDAKIKRLWLSPSRV